MKIHRKHAVGAAALLLAAAAPFAQAANLVANGDFETGDLSHWTLAGDTSVVGVDPFAAFDGSFGAYFGSEGTTTISQELSTLGGGAFQVSFWLELQDSARPNSFSWSWNGVAQSPLLADAASFPYTKFSAVVGASGSATSTLSFSFANPQSFWLLDDVTVSAVPEPSSLLMAGAGLALFALVRRRRPANGSNAARS